MGNKVPVIQDEYLTIMHVYHSNITQKLLNKNNNINKN